MYEWVLFLFVERYVFSVWVDHTELGLQNRLPLQRCKNSGQY